MGEELIHRQLGRVLWDIGGVETGVVAACGLMLSTPFLTSSEPRFIEERMWPEERAHERIMARWGGAWSGPKPRRRLPYAATLTDSAAIKADPAYARSLADLAGAKLDSIGSDAERIAFWMNAYNLLAIKAVIDRYPVKSIKDGGSLVQSIWKKKVGTVAGREYALDEIEHDILRRQFREPRAHFAIVCASLWCPDLRPEPYQGARLDAQIAESAAFLANPTKGLQPWPDGKTARVSSTFKWFADDFAAQGGVAQFIRRNADAPTAARLSGLTDRGLSYLDYDWSLNDVRRAARR